MRLEVRTFGGLAERAGLSTLVIDLPDGSDVAGLRRAVATRHPELAPLMPRVAVSVDLELAPTRRCSTTRWRSRSCRRSPVVRGRRPPTRRTVTGLVHGPLDVDGTLARIGASDVGAIVSFLGTVRDHAEDLDGVVRLEYSAYDRWLNVSSIASPARSAPHIPRSVAWRCCMRWASLRSERTPSSSPRRPPTAPRRSTPAAERSRRSSPRPGVQARDRPLTAPTAGSACPTRTASDLHGGRRRFTRRDRARAW
jgi:hypothetical protein